MPKKVVPLSDTKIASAKSKQKQYTLNDGDGLRLVVTASSRKYFRFDYTRPNGKRNSISIGTYPGTTLKEAREQREKYRKMVFNGIDPAEEKQKTKVDEDKFFKNISTEFLRHKNRDKAKSTIENNERKVKYMNEAFGDKDINEITVQEISKLLLKFHNEGKNETARRILSTLRAIYKYAISTGVASHNRAADIDTTALLGKKKVKHYDFIDNEKEFADLLLSIDDYFGDPITQLALKYASMDFLRPGNVRGLLWDQVDMENKLIIYSDDDMKSDRKHLVPITRQIKDVLDEAAKLSKGRSIYVFPSPISNVKMLSENTLNMAIKRMGFAGRMTSHGFRHTASTLLHEHLHIHNVSSDAIEVQMAHKDDTTKGIYNHAKYLPERTRLMEWWCDYLDEIKVKYAPKA